MQVTPTPDTVFPPSSVVDIIRALGGFCELTLPEATLDEGEIRFAVRAECNDRIEDETLIVIDRNRVSHWGTVDVDD